MNHKTIKIALLVALAFVLAISTTALADVFASYMDWTGQGSGSMDCSKVGQGPRTEDGWIHWIVTNAKDVTAAQLVLSGTGTGTYAPNKMGSVIEFFTPYYKIDGLMARLYYNGKLSKSSQFVISDYCPVVYKPLTATKTANGSYERNVEWKLEKSVDDNYHEGFAGEKAGDSVWKVVATKTETLGKYLVTGQITINNPNKIAVDFKVEDVLDDGTVATVTCPDTKVPAFGSITCTYEAKPSGGTATKNTATVTALTPYVTGATAVKDFTYKEILVGYDKGLLTDPRFKYENEISATTTVTFSEAFYCSDKASDYTKGFYSYTVVNEAILDSNIGLKDSAEVKVDCYLPALKVEKTAAGTWDREVKWELDKSVDEDSFKGGPGDVFAATWKVVATKTVIGPKNFVVTGVITITNPAAIPQTFTLEDTLVGAREDLVSVTCPEYTVPASGSITCTYTASQPDATAKKNVVVVTAPGNDPVRAEADVKWTEKLTGYDEGTLKDPRFEYKNDINTSITVTFEEKFTCSEDLTQYTNGFYTYTVDNWAYLNGNLNLKDSATVEVACYLKFYGETAWAANGNIPLELPYPGANWATYVAYAPKTVTLFAGQTMPAGTVTFSAPVDEEVTITINLTGAWLFDPFKTVTLHVQDYALAPTDSNPAPGQFAYSAACTGKVCTIVVPANKFYGVHANVGYWGK